MIKNERQYIITKNQINKFEEAVRKYKKDNQANPLLAKIELEALESKLQDLRIEVAEYEIRRYNFRSLGLF